MVRPLPRLKPLSLLITLRDLGAGFHIIEIIKYAQSDTRFEVEIWAQAPAADTLKSENIDFLLIPEKPINSNSGKEAVEFLLSIENLIKSRNFDACLVGLSTPFDGGIDEAVLATADCPKFLFQDFWGEMNLFFGGQPDVAFVIDDFAKRRTEERFSVEAQVVGSPRHHSYTHLNLRALRGKVRKFFGIGNEREVVVYFAQALSHFDGYHDTVNELIKALNTVERDLAVIVKPHPRDNTFAKEKLKKVFTESELEAYYSDTFSVEELLSASDVSFSVFSNSNLDACFYNWFSRDKICVPISLLFNKEMSEYYKKVINYDELPIFVSNLVIPVTDKSQLGLMIKNSFDRSFRRDFHKHVQSCLTDPSQASEITLDLISKRCKRL